MSTTSDQPDQLEAELARLRTRVAELELQLEAATQRGVHAEAQWQQTDLILHAVIDHIPDWIFIKDQNHRYHLINQSYATVLHQPAEAVLGKNDLDLGFPEALVKGDPARGIRGFWTDDRMVMESGKIVVNPHDPATVDGEEHIFYTTKVPVRDPQGVVWGVLGIARDITKQEQNDLIRLQTEQQEAIIAAQQAAIQELSTPLIPVAEGVVVMPIIGVVESSRALQIIETLLGGINQHQAHTAILDITGVKVVDSQVAAALVRAAHAARLLGTKVVLTGISPEIAQTLVHIGAELTSITTHGSLQRAIQQVIYRGTDTVPYGYGSFR